MATHRDIQARIEEIPADLRLAVYMRDGFACLYCGDTLEGGAVFTVDHIRPRQLGGSHEADNLVTCCSYCNTEKRHLVLHVFLLHLESYGRLLPGTGERIAAALATPIGPFLERARADIARRAK